MNLKLVLFSICIISLLSSCNSYKKVAYLKGVETIPAEQLAKAKATFVPKITPGDLLTITVNVVDQPMAAVPFNLPLIPVSGNGIGGVSTTMGVQTYLVDESGNIEFPTLGKLNLAGKTRTEVEKLIKSQIYPKYVTVEPIVNVRFANFTVSVLGEVVKPGPYTFPTENVTLLDALAAAGDMTIYGKRDKVLLNRTGADGSSEYVSINLQDKNLVLSPYFYLQPEDVIYVEPNKARGNSSSIGSTESLTISVVSVLISVATLIVSASK